MSMIIIPSSSGKLGRTITKDYNQISILDSDSERIAKCEMWIAKKVGTELMNQLPNREWGVRVDVVGRIMIITCDSLSTTKGYHINMTGYTLDSLAARAVKAGCEILERYNISRQRSFNPDTLETLARDVNDEVISCDAKPD